MDKLVEVRFLIDKRLRARFKALTALKNTTMRETLTAMIERYLSESVKHK